MEPCTRFLGPSSRLIYVNDSDPTLDVYSDNKISNTKYTLINFIPKNLWEQFKRFMNQYFLLIACLQLWPLITPVNPVSTWGPLIVIFAVSASKEAWDDYYRYTQDKVANQRRVWVVRNGLRIQLRSQDIRVGDLVWICGNDEVPCDMVLLGTSEHNGLSYVETAAIDGETDLKTRVVPLPCVGLTSDLLHKLKGLIQCPGPDADLMRFDANLRLFPPFVDNDFCPLTASNILLQSCILRNTEWACGVAVYTGNETKVGMSKGLPEPKLTSIDSMIDKLTAAIFAFQLVVVLILGIAGNVWRAYESHKMWFLKYPKFSPWFDFLVIPLRFELLCSIMIPISIKVSLDLMKGLYAKFINWDLHMYDEKTDTPAAVSNTGISEDLGQVEFILTDKTGTLTENVMVFKLCCIKGICYGSLSGDALADPTLRRAVGLKNPDIVKFLMVMAVCNTVVPNKGHSGVASYQAQSQDEEALVKAAAELQMVLTQRSGSTVELNFLGTVVKYELLDILEFTSDRKRMSVVIREADQGKIMLLTKGADEAILPFIRLDQQFRPVAEVAESYARMGLRTLCLAYREIESDEYQRWSSEFREASSSLTEREWKVAEVCQRLERNFELLGVTGIEDKLQEGVPETIETLRKAGINFWMLTGDRHSTAVQIALACNLVLPEPEGHILRIEGQTPHEVSVSLERVLQTMRITSIEHKGVAFVIDGMALEIALKHWYETFAELAMLSKTAICCRVTPSQKAQLVEIIKSCDYRTLAIGDGGNDVKMIQEAHVGVGISGHEGLQAARAADFSIAKFHFLKRLILIHGRYSYIRTAFLAQYSIYKSLLICFIQIFFSFLSGLAGTSLFNSFSLMAYNVVYTSVPVMVSCLDKDISEKTVFQHPQILYLCQIGRHINPSTFAGWFGRAVFHASVVFLVTIHVYAHSKHDMEEMAMVALSGCLWLQAFLVALETNHFTMYQHCAIWGNLLVFYFINFVFSTFRQGGMYTIMFRVCSQPTYWLAIMLIVVAGIGPLLAVKYLRGVFRPTALHALQQLERARPVYSGVVQAGGRNIDKENMPLPLTRMCADHESVYEPLLCCKSPPSMKWGAGVTAPGEYFDYLPPSPTISVYSRNKNK